MRRAEGAPLTLPPPTRFYEGASLILENDGIPSCLIAKQMHMHMDFLCMQTVLSQNINNSRNCILHLEQIQSMLAISSDPFPHPFHL